MDTCQSNHEWGSGTSEGATLAEKTLVGPRKKRTPGGAMLIPTRLLRAGVFSVRVSARHDDSSVLELAKSVSAVGIIAPIVVRKSKRGGFEVIAGERRLLAARLLRMGKVPCIVRVCTEAEAFTLSLTENLQRNNLSPIEKARGLMKLLADMGLTQQEIGERIGMPQSAIAHYLRLLRLPAEVQQLIHDGALSTGHGKVLAGVKDPKHAIDLALDCIANNRSVRDLEASLSAAVDRVVHGSSDSAKKMREERELPNGVFLVIKEHGDDVGSGKIEIPYYSLTEKEWVLRALLQSRNV